MEAGREYALVGTNLHGGVLVRYVVGDAVKIISLSDERIGLKVPQMVFSTRIDDTIDIAGFTRLTEKSIWTAVEASGIPLRRLGDPETVPRGEPHPSSLPRDEGRPEGPGDVQAIIHASLKKTDTPYRDLEEMAGIKPLVVTLLTPGTFTRYLQERQAAGVDLAHSKPRT